MSEDSFLFDQKLTEVRGALCDASLAFAEKAKLTRHASDADQYSRVSLRLAETAGEVEKLRVSFVSLRVPFDALRSAS